jgi:hypothetical protein
MFISALLIIALKLEKTQMPSMDRWIIEVYPYNGILLCHKKV